MPRKLPFDVVAGATFLAVARAGSFRRAGEQLHLATSAVSRQIARLERSVGCSLLERRAGGVVLTSDGAVFRDHMTEVMARLEELRDAVAGDTPGKAGEVRIATIEGITRDFLSGLILQAQAARPGLAFDVDIRPRDQVFGALETYEADLGFLYDHFTHPTITPVATWRQPLLALAPPSHPLAAAPAVTLADIAGVEAVLPHGSFGIHSLVQRAFRAEGLVPKVALTSNHLHFLTTHAIASGAVLFAPLRAVLAEVQSGALVPLALDCPLFAHRHVAVAVRQGRRLSVPAAAFLDAVRAAFSRAEVEDAAILARLRRQG